MANVRKDLISPEQLADIVQSLADGLIVKAGYSPADVLMIASKLISVVLPATGAYRGADREATRKFMADYMNGLAKEVDENIDDIFNEREQFVARQEMINKLKKGEEV